jgi:hypothetical protein
MIFSELYNIFYSELSTNNNKYLESYEDNRK